MATIVGDLREGRSVWQGWAFLLKLTSDRETTTRMRVESSVPTPFILLYSLSAKKPGRPRAHNTGKGEREEGGKEGRREGRREGGKEGRREGGKEGRREGGKEGRREGGKEGRREGGKEGRREGGKEGRRRKLTQTGEKIDKYIHALYAICIATALNAVNDCTVNTAVLQDAHICVQVYMHARRVPNQQL